MPIAALTQDGLVLVTGRYGLRSQWRVDVSEQTYLEPIESTLEPDVSRQKGLLQPLDLDASPFADSGYAGWVECERGRFLCANYINDDAPLAQIRGYRFGLDDF